MSNNNTNTVNVGFTRPPVTTLVEDIMPLSLPERVVWVEDCPEIKMVGRADD